MRRAVVAQPTRMPHLHSQMANGAPSWPTKTAQTSMVIEELVDGPETIVLQVFQMTLDAAAHATQPVVRPQLADISSTAAWQRAWGCTLLSITHCSSR